MPKRGVCRPNIEKEIPLKLATLQRFIVEYHFFGDINFLKEILRNSALQQAEKPHLPLFLCCHRPVLVTLSLVQG